MNEVEKMYRNAHVYPRVYGDITKETFENKVFNMSDMCNEAFTAERQLELIKCLTFESCDRTLEIFYNYDNYVFSVMHIGTDEVFEGINKDFAEALAKLTNELWQDLTEEEKQQIKEILSE